MQLEMLVYIFLCWILIWKLEHYQSYWYRGSLHCQAIRNHDTVKCRYNPVQYSKILKWLQELW